MIKKRLEKYIVILSPEAFALQRMLGVVQRRGFLVEALCLDRVVEFDAFRVEMTVSGSRPFVTLVKQIDKLADVQSVKQHSLENLASDRSGSDEANGTDETEKSIMPGYATIARRPRKSA